VDGLHPVETALQYIFYGYIGTWYIWGGDNPKGFDCSGLAVEYLKACGLVGRNEDYTAASLYKKFSEFQTPLPTRNCLIFFKSKDKINHVEIALNDRQSVGASGGTSKIKNEFDAMNHDAFIKVRTFHDRKPYAYINMRLAYEQINRIDN